MQNSLPCIVRKLRQLLGIKLLILFLSVVPLGVVVGLIEIGFSFALQNFLAVFHLLPSESVSIPWFASRPVLFIILIIVAQTIINFLAAAVPGVAYEAFNSRIRSLVATHAFGTDRERIILTVSEVGNLLSTTVPKVAVFFSSCMQLLSAGFILITMLVGMLTFSIPLTGIALATSVLFILPMVPLKSSFQNFSANVYRHSAEFITKMLRNIQNIYFLRIVGTLQYELKSLVSLNRKIVQNYIRYNVAVTANSTLPLFVGAFIVVGVVVINDQNHYLTSALLIPFVYLLTRLSSAVSRVVASVGQLQFGYPFFLELLRTNDELLPAPSVESSNRQRKLLHTPQRLIVRNLIIGREKELVAEMNFDVGSGDFLLIAGKSGAGKTTLLMTLIGIISKLSGEILWNGTPIEEVDLHSLKRCVGYSGSDPFLFDGSIEENMLYGTIDKISAKNNIASALSLAQCGFINQLDGGIAYRLQEGGEGLSAGQKQRISIARALLRMPKILLLDEATSNIDESTEKSILTSIRSSFPELLVIAVSHRNSLQQFATHQVDIL